MKLSRSVLFGVVCALVLSGAVVTVAHAVVGVPIVGSIGAPASDISEGGGPLTINGMNFFDGTSGSAVTQVGFGASGIPFVPYMVNGAVNSCPSPPTAAAGCYVSVSDTQIVMETHDHAAATVDITVTTPAGTSAVTPNDRFTFNANTPKAASLSAHSGPAGSTITISPADNLQEASAFDFATAITFTPASGSGTPVVVRDPSGFACPAGPVPAAGCFNLSKDLVILFAPSTGFTYGTVYDVTVSTAGGNSPVSAATDQFTFVAAPFSPKGVGAPSVAVSSDGTTQLVFWQGAGSHLVEAWWNGAWNGPVDWTTVNGWAPSVNSAPSVLVQANGTQVVFWEGPGGHLFEAWWNGSWNGPVDWTAARGWAPTVASAPSIAIAADGTTQLIFWKGSNAHLYEAWFNGAWNGPVDWTAAKGWPASMTSAPSAALTGSTQIIFWQGTGGHLIEVWWNGSWNGPVDWSA
jgi:hypothetical protein